MGEGFDMSGLPYLEFFPSDWIKDTRALSPEAKGAWIDIISTLHFSDTRGSLALTFDGWARVTGQTPEMIRKSIAELRLLEVCDCHESNGVVTLESRRMLRESITKEQTRQRAEKSRHKQKDLIQPPSTSRNNHAEITLESRESNGTETIIHKPESIEHTLPPAEPAAEGIDPALQDPLTPHPDAIEPSPFIPPSEPPAPKAKVKTPRARRPDDDLIDELCRLTGTAPSGETGKALQIIRTLTPAVTVAEITRRAANYTTYFPETRPSPNAYAKWWPTCDTPNPIKQVNGRSLDPRANIIDERVRIANEKAAASYLPENAAHCMDTF